MGGFNFFQLKEKNHKMDLCPKNAKVYRFVTSPSCILCTFLDTKAIMGRGRLIQEQGSENIQKFFISKKEPKCSF